jgi:hypothetical protein
VSTLTFFTAVYLAHKGEKHGLSPNLNMFAYAYIPSYLCAIQTISFKSLSEFATNAAKGTSNEWDGPYPWIFLCFIILCAVFQFTYINLGAAKFQATRYFPVYNSTLMVITVFFGLIFFEEYKGWGKGAAVVAFPLGVVILCVGIVLLSWADPTDKVHVAAESGHGAASVAPVFSDVSPTKVNADQGKISGGKLGIVTMSFAATSPSGSPRAAVEMCETPATDAVRAVSELRTYNVTVQGPDAPPSGGEGGGHKGHQGKEDGGSPSGTVSPDKSRLADKIGKMRQDSSTLLPRVGSFTGMVKLSPTSAQKSLGGEGGGGRLEGRQDAPALLPRVGSFQGKVRLKPLDSPLAIATANEEKEFVAY